MITHVRASENIGDEARLFQYVVETSVPLEKDPPVITFSVLESKGKVIDVSENNGHAVIFGEDPYLVRAMGLQTCAAVCFVNREHSDDLKGYVYHANTGTVPNATFKEIMKAIDAQEHLYRHVHVIYAHPKGSDGGYTKNMDELDRWLLSKGKIVEVTHVPGVSFGMNQSVRVGY